MAQTTSVGIKVVNKNWNSPDRNNLTFINLGIIFLLDLSYKREHPVNLNKELYVRPACLSFHKGRENKDDIIRDKASFLVFNFRHTHGLYRFSQIYTTSKRLEYCKFLNIIKIG